MATQVDPKELDIRAQVASIDEALANAARHRAEIEARQAEREKIIAETRYLAPTTIFQALIATAALLGAGAAIAKLFF